MTVPHDVPLSVFFRVPWAAGRNSFKWEMGPDLPHGFIMGGSVSYSDSRGWIIVGGEDENGKYFDDIIWYNKGKRMFETLPGKLQMARSGFGAVITHVPDKC